NFSFAATARPGEDVQVAHNWVSPGLLSTLGVPLLAGREITEADRAGGEKVAVVNQTLARKIYGTASPVGRRFARGPGGGTKRDATTVGAVPDGPYDAPRTGGQPFISSPYPQKERNRGPAPFYVRTAAGAPPIGSAVGAGVRRLDPDLPVSHLKTM